MSGFAPTAVVPQSAAMYFIPAFSVAEALFASETETVTLGLAGPVSESETASESNAVTVALSAPMPESLAALESAIGGEIFSDLIVEAGGAIDALSDIASFAATASETASAADALGTKLNAVQPLMVEAGMISETTLDLAVDVVSTSESAAAIDAVRASQSMMVPASEHATTVETSVGGHVLNVVLAELGAAQEAIAASAALYARGVETASLSEVVDFLARLYPEQTRAALQLRVRTSAAQAPRVRTLMSTGLQGG